MEDLLTYLVTSIVEHPESVSITTELDSQGGTRFLVEVAEDDIGMVIGKRGKTIRAIRTLMRMKAIKENLQIRVDIVEPERPPENIEDSPFA